MPVQIGEQVYYTNHEVATRLGISRQTLWRWREKGKTPAGLRFRNRQVLFTDAELDEIRAYANHLEPIALGGQRQLGLFARTRENA
jgi:excisionase family DNA binding protein